MRVTDLLGREVVDTDGRVVGRVRDLRLRQGDAPGDWTVVGLVLGRGVVAERLGYAYGTATGPWILAAVMRRIARHMRYVAWEDVDRRDGDGPLTLRRRAQELPHPDETEDR